MCHCDYHHIFIICLPSSYLKFKLLLYGWNVFSCNIMNVFSINFQSTNSCCLFKLSGSTVLFFHLRFFFHLHFFFRPLYSFLPFFILPFLPSLFSFHFFFIFAFIPSSPLSLVLLILRYTYILQSYSLFSSLDLNSRPLLSQLRTQEPS